MISDMKSVMVFDPKESQEETERKWRNWIQHNKKREVGDKYVPSLTETRRMLREYEY